MGLINPDSRQLDECEIDATAVGGSAGSVVYHQRPRTAWTRSSTTKPGRCELRDRRGSVLEPADANFTTNWRSFRRIGFHGSLWFNTFLGIAPGGDDGRLLRLRSLGPFLRCQHQTMTPAGDLLCIDGSTDGEAALYFTKIGTITDAKVADNTRRSSAWSSRRKRQVRPT